MKNVLIIGGTSGLGLELGLLLKSKYKVFVTGRKGRPTDPEISFLRLNIDSSQGLSAKIKKLLSRVKRVDLLIYAAGFYQSGTISELPEKEISNMIAVGLYTPAVILQKILLKQKKLAGFIAISSTSSRIPRLNEPVYSAIKSGINMLANSVSLDKRVEKTLVASPAGMRTNFWKGNKRKGVLLDPKWLAEKILREFQKKFSYKHIMILRDPPRLRDIEKRL